MSVSPPPLPTLDDASRQLIQQARVRRKRIDRVLSLAGFNGWSAAILAVVSAMVLSLDRSMLTIAVVVVLGAVAAIEFRGRKLVQRLDPRGLPLLTCNQAALGLLVIIYAVWRLATLSTSADPEMQELQSLGATGQQFADMEHSIGVLIYATLIAATLIFQGGMALFYWRSRGALRTFIAETPQWVRDVLIAAT